MPSVTHCICHNVPFAEILRLRRTGMTFEQISLQTGCCTGCGTCEPYVRLAIRTNRSALPVLDGPTMATIMEDAHEGPENRPPADSGVS